MPVESPRSLPRPVSELHIAPFQQGRAGLDCFLVETRAGAFLVNRRMRCLLEALAEQSQMTGVKAHLEASLGQSVDEAEVSAAIAGLPRSVFQDEGATARNTPFHFAFRLLPARIVQALAGPMRFLYSPPAVVAVCIALIFELPWLVPAVAQGIGTPLDSWGVASLVLGAGVIALVHELGHAAACAWYRMLPGEIGFGLYLVFPVFYTDVTKTWRLSPPQRAVVDAGGIYFQLVLIALAVPLARGLGDGRWAGAFVLYNLYLVLHNLNPLFKMDGYWIFSDLAGLPNLHKRTWRALRQALLSRCEPGQVPPWTEKGRALLLLHAYALAVLVYAGFVAVALPRWYAVQLAPYPMLAAAHLRSIASAWSATDYNSMRGEVGALALASLIPGLVLVLLVSLVVRGGRRLFATRKVP